MKKPFSVVIAGGGMVGLTTAALLKNVLPSSRVRVIDAGSAPHHDTQSDVGPRVSAISLGSVRLLDDLGVWPEVLATRVGPYRAMRVWDAASTADSPDALNFDAADFALAELGFIVENDLLRSALYSQCQRLDVELDFDRAMERVARSDDGERATVTLASGEALSPDILVGADGGASFVRSSLSIDSRLWRYPQSALVTHVSSERPHRETAWQRFLPAGPLALLPLPDGRSSVVWSDAPERVDDALAAGDEELGARLTDASDGILGRLQVAGPCASFPLRAQHAARYIAPGVALVGDAAHSVHPLAGQGVNLGFGDAHSLAVAIGDAVTQGEYPGDLPTLRAYERARRGANAAMLHFTDGLNRLFMSRSAPLATLRRRGMRLFNRSGPIRRHAVQVALGITV